MPHVPAFTRYGPAPTPPFAARHQSGIADPMWPEELPDGRTEEEYATLRGAIAMQECLSIALVDLEVGTPGAVRDVLQKVSTFARGEMEMGPSKSHAKPLAYLEDSYRVTVTIALGASLFLAPDGRPRFPFADRKPRGLRFMPRFPRADDPAFNPAADRHDLLVMVCSDHHYVNTAVWRKLAQYVDPRLRVRRIEHGFSRPDTREFLRFDDGVANPRNWPHRDIDRLAFVTRRDDEPHWCAGGSYLVYRKIAENLRGWEALSDRRQEKMIGRRKKDNQPLTPEPDRDPDDPRIPTYPSETDDSAVPLTSHIRKVQPRRPGDRAADPFGVPDLDRRIVRRPYPFDDGIDPDGAPRCGLHFLAFMRNIDAQFEFVLNMWQLNDDFPLPGTGIDALFEKDRTGQSILRTVAGGYYFCPPAPTDANDFVGAGLFAP